MIALFRLYKNGFLLYQGESVTWAPYFEPFLEDTEIVDTDPIRNRHYNRYQHGADTGL